MDKILLFFSSVVLSISSFFGFSKSPASTLLVTDVTPTIFASTTPTISITNSPTSHSATSSMTINKNNQIPTSTPSQEIIELCNNILKPVKYFAGFKCYYEAYTAEKNKNKDENKGSAIDSLKKTIQIDSVAKNGLEELLFSACIRVTPTLFKSCSESLERNVERLYKQIEINNTSEVSECVSKIAVGDEKMKNTTKNYFNAWKLKQKIDDIYNHCVKFSGNLDNYVL